MIRKGMTVSDAVHAWVETFNRFPLDMIQKLMIADMDCGGGEWEEVTVLVKGDRCYSCIENEYGEVVRYDSEKDHYIVKLDSGRTVADHGGRFEKQTDDTLPMWGSMWQFDDRCDDLWLEECDGIAKMSECGFRIYHHEEWGYFFGIDGAGYDFYEQHWIPLYKARELHWHDAETEKED